MSEVRVPYVSNEPLVEGIPNVRVPYVGQEPLMEGIPNVRVSLSLAEPLMEGIPNIRIPLICIETLFPIPEDLPVSTIPFPGFGNSVSTPSIPAAADPFDTPLPGLSFSVHKKPMFNTNIKGAPSGVEVRNAMAEYPRWEFNLNYEFLEDRSGAESSLKTIMSFFLARQGSFDTWLFKDPDDYLCINSFCATSDGLTTDFPLCRTMGEFTEKVCQIDTVNTITLYLSVVQASTIPASGPYTRTVTHSATFIEDLGVIKDGTTAMTKVSGSPAAGEYSVAAGVYTFNSTDHGDTIAISYRYQLDPADYTITLPNLVVFDAALPAGDLSGDFQFYFACRFLEDSMDFEKFYDRLWNLQQCDFKSIIQ